MSEARTLEARKFLGAVEALCGEANEAARLAASLFDGEQKTQVRRALARCMELVETDVLPAFRDRFSELGSGSGAAP